MEPGSVAAIAPNERDRARHASKFSTETTLRSAPRDTLRSQSATSSFGRAYGSGRRRMPCTRLKIAQLHPMPSANVTTTAAVNPGFFRSTRSA